MAAGPCFLLAPAISKHACCLAQHSHLARSLPFLLLTASRHSQYATNAPDQQQTEPNSTQAQEQPQQPSNSSAAANNEPVSSGRRVAAGGWLQGPEVNKFFKRVEDEWELISPEGSPAVYHSILTGQTTVAGAPKPDTWIEVVDKRTGLIYYWCKRTGETTTLGEPKPGPYGRKAQAPSTDEYLDDSTRSLDGGSRGSDKGPGLGGLVKKPVVIGVLSVALICIGYELVFG